MKTFKTIQPHHEPDKMLDKVPEKIPDGYYITVCDCGAIATYKHLSGKFLCHRCMMYNYNDI